MLDVDKEAMAKIVEYASKLSGDKEKLSTQFSEIGQIVGEASTWAKLDKSKIVTKDYVQKAFDERIERIKKYDTKYLQMIKEGALLINTSGFEVLIKSLFSFIISKYLVSYFLTRSIRSSKALSINLAASFKELLNFKNFK